MSRRIVPVLLVVVGGCFGFDDLEARALSALDGGAAGGASGGMAGGVAGGASGGTAGGMSGGAAGGESGGMAGGVAGGASGGASGGTSGGAAGGSSGGMAGGVAGGTSGGMAGGASGGMAGGASGGIAGGTSGGTAGGAGQGDGGVTDGGACAPESGAFAQSCPCVCQDGGCSGVCVFRELRPGVVPWAHGAAMPFALTASANRVFVVTTIDAGRLLELDQNLQSLDASVIPGTLRVLDARRGVGAAITSSGVYSTNGVSQTVPSGVVSSCQGGGIYELNGTTRPVAACQVDGGGFEAFDVYPGGFSQGASLPMPLNATDQSLVWIRPDVGGSVGRYLIRPGVGLPWAYRTFMGSSIIGTESNIDANQAVLATTEDQRAMLALRDAAGIVRYRPLGTTLSASTQTRLTSPRVDLRGVFSFSGDGGTPFPVDVYVLERDGTLPPPTFLGFTLSGPSQNGWFVVLDRPQGVLVYSLGDLDSAQAVIVEPGRLLVLSRCSFTTGPSVCMADAGTWLEWLPLD
jgi:hypothetical protein